MRCHEKALFVIEGFDNAQRLLTINFWGKFVITRAVRRKRAGVIEPFGFWLRSLNELLRNYVVGTRSFKYRLPA